MAIDRTATLKNAEKLLRQGKIQPAIEEYLRLANDQPRDWNVVNTLGDLYVRAGQVDKAVEQFTRIADSLSEEGFLPKASAIYKKILKLRPEHEHALLQAAEIAGGLGLLADARSYLGQIIERRLGRGDKRGAAQARIRLGSLDPADFDGRMMAARARLEIGDVAGAARDLREIAAQLVEQGRPADAVEALREAVKLAPDDDEIRQGMLDIFLASGDFAHARECASTAEQLKELAARLQAAGHADAALEALGDAAHLNPSDSEVRSDLARAHIARGDVTAAAQYLTVFNTSDDPQLLFTVAEMKLRGNDPGAGLTIVGQLLARYPDRREDVALLGWTIAEQLPELGFKVVELAADAAVSSEDWASAAAALQEFVTRAPTHIPALLRLVEVCVDGGLEATMYSAQAHLADAYIETGQAAEARFIAEDLVAREPWDRSNIERFRRALELQGEPDPEALIAERLSGQSPFMTTDIFFESPDLRMPASAPDDGAIAGGSSVAPGIQAPVESDVQGEPAPDQSEKRAGKPGSKPAHAESDGFEIGGDTIDLESLLGELESPPIAHASSESVEVDLSIVLDDMKPPPKRLDAAEDARRAAMEEAEREYTRGLALRDAGDLDGAIVALQAASKAPQLRFVTASLLGEMFRDRAMNGQAVEWFERASQAPAPTVEQGRELLYELADALEKEGETARALAVALELQADAGAYRDLEARIERLTKVQARG